MARQGLRIDANYVEDVVAIEIASFLSKVSFPQLRFSIEPLSRPRERWVGADARLTDSMRGFLPFYMQFKRPSAYPENSTSRIIQDRLKIRPNPLQTSPLVLFFQLLNKRPQHIDYQHNVLYRLNDRLRNSNKGAAVYVCPLFLDRQAYIHNLHMSSQSQVLRVYPDRVVTSSLVVVHSVTSSGTLANVPLIREHICIPPHALVTHAKHSY